jgi:hypothetical protein
MNRPYLLIAGDHYYPQGGTSDWIGCFSTYEEALGQVQFVVSHDYYTKGKNKGEIKSTRTTYKVKGGEYGARGCDWYEIVDLRGWTQ